MCFHDFARGYIQAVDLQHTSYIWGFLPNPPEEDVCIGGCFQIGTAQMLVTQPRTPCYKLAAKFGRTDIVRHFLETGYSGFYLAVLREGEVGGGDAIQVIAQTAQRVPIAALNKQHGTPQKRPQHSS